MSSISNRINQTAQMWATANGHSLESLDSAGQQQAVDAVASMTAIEPAQVREELTAIWAQANERGAGREAVTGAGQQASANFGGGSMTNSPLMARFASPTLAAISQEADFPETFKAVIASAVEALEDTSFDAVRFEDRYDVRGWNDDDYIRVPLFKGDDGENYAALIPKGDERMSEFHLERGRAGMGEVSVMPIQTNADATMSTNISSLNMADDDDIGAALEKIIGETAEPARRRGGGVSLPGVTSGTLGGSARRSGVTLPGQSSGTIGGRSSRGSGVTMPVID